MKMKAIAAVLAMVIPFSGCSRNKVIDSQISESAAYLTESADSSEANTMLSESSESNASSAENTAEEVTEIKLSKTDDSLLTKGTESYRSFLVDNVYHSPNSGDIHFNLYVPESYDGSRPYELFVTLPGYEGLYFQGVAANIKSEEFGFEAQKYNSEMIVAAPQLSDWHETSADQTIALTEFMIDRFNIGKVYANGYSGGGETLSLVLEKRPELFAACLHVSSRWDGDLTPVAKARLPVYFAIGENDEYYGSQPARSAYEELYRLYEKQGLSDGEIGELAVLDVKNHDYFTEKNMSNEHGGGGLFAFDQEIMGWLFKH